MSENSSRDDATTVWKRRPSEIRGYTRTLYIVDENKDYLRVDYNLKEKRVRLYVEINAEGNSAYYSVIKDGKKTVERSVVSGRSQGFSEKFIAHAEIFSTIPNKASLKLINGNYGIGKNSFQASENKRDERRARLEETKRKYFNIQENPYSKNGKIGGSHNRDVHFSDFIDLILGVVLSGGVFLLYQYSFIGMGIISAFYGISLGFIDMFIREKPPLFIKILFFILFGTTSYIFGYFL